MKEITTLVLTLQELNDLIDQRVEEALLHHRVSPWMTQDQAEAYTQFSQYVLFEARRDGELKVIKRNRSLRYHKDDLDAWLRSRYDKKRDKDK